jgi:hypothetical protein
MGDERALSDEQIEDLRERQANPGRIASDDEVEAFFARFSARGCKTLLSVEAAFTTKARSTRSSTKK